MRLLVKGARIVTMDPGLKDVERGDILIEDGVIHAVGPSLHVQDADVLDAGGMITVPGFVNAHIHTWQTALRGTGADWTSAQYMRNIHSGAATRYTAADNHDATLYGALAQISGGTTTLFDWCHNLRSPDMTDASLDALDASGIRAVFGHGTAKPPEIPGQAPYWELPHPRDEVARLRHGRLASDHHRVTLAMCILGPDWSTYEVAQHDIRMAREFGLMTSAHTWGRPGARRCPDGMWRLAREGLLGPDHNLAHGNYLDTDEMKMIVDAGCTITATSLSEMMNSQMPAVMGRVEALGQVASLGSDLAPHFNGSMLSVARHAFLHQRESDNRALSVQGAWPPARHATTARHALRWITEGGAKALGLWDRIGSITPGKQADLVLVRCDSPHMFPAAESDAAAALVMYAEHADIDTVLVGGHCVKRDGKLVYAVESLARLQESLGRSRSRLLMSS